MPDEPSNRPSPQPRGQKLFIAGLVIVALTLAAITIVATTREWGVQADLPQPEITESPAAAS